MHLIGALFKALGQLPDPAFRRVALKAFIASVFLFAAIVAAASWGLAQIELAGIGWIDTTLDILGAAAAFVIGLVLFPGLAMMVVGLLLEDIVQAVEARHYPSLPAARRQKVIEAIVVALRLAAVTVVLNLLLLPVYVLIPAINIFVFYALNGYLLGREYFELVALRRLDVAGARAMRRRHRGRIVVGGVIVALLLSIPIVNWAMPVVAVAFMVHVFQNLNSRAANV